MPARKRGTAHTRNEVLHFLTHALIIAPFNMDEWQRVVEEHAEVYPEKQRDITSIKRKFQGLIKCTGPPGDPNFPEEVRLTKKEQ